MPRSDAEIAASLAAGMQTANPGIDVQTGYLPRAIITPVSEEFAAVEAEADHTDQLVSLNFSEAATSQELRNVGGALSIEPMPGTASQGFVVFATAIRPDPLETKTVPVASLVGTASGGLMYQTTRLAELPGSNADAFYVAARRRFELRVPVEALAVGADHDVPPGRINTIYSNIDFASVTNLEAISGGSDAESEADFASRCRERLLGIDRGVSGGLIEEARRFDKRVKAATPVYSTDVDLFRRRVVKPAIDLYISGSYDRLVTDTYTAVGGETSFVLTSVPVISITSVTVNASPVDYALSVDATRETGGSTIANDRVILTSALSPGDQLEVSYVANGLLLDMQQEYQLEGDDSRFGTAILVRKYREVQVQVQVIVVGLSTFSEVALTDAVKSQVDKYVNSGAQNVLLTPRELRDTIKENVAGISRINVTVFRRVDSGPGFGVLTFAKNEISVSSTDLIDVSVRR